MKAPVPTPSLVAEHPDVEPLLDPGVRAQRARLLEGMTIAVAEKGYAAATVSDAVRAARVSRGTFYALFASKEECFLEAYRHGTDVLVGRIHAAVAAEQGGWDRKLRAALGAYLETLAGEPRFARAHLQEVHSAGPGAQAARDAALRRFAERYRMSFEAALKQWPELVMPSDDALFVLAAGIDQLVCAHVRSAGVARLGDLHESLFDCAVAVFAGAASVNTIVGEQRWT